MSLIVEIKEQLENAMRDGDAARRDTLRLILASLQGAEKELQRLTDQFVAEVDDTIAHKEKELLEV